MTYPFTCLILLTNARVADLRAAGLNPILSVNNGASTPAVSTPGYSDQSTSGLNAALQVKQAQAVIDNIKADTAKKSLSNKLLILKARLTWSTLKMLNVLALSLMLNFEAAANAAIYSSDAGQIIKAIDKIAPGAGSIINSAKSVKGLISKSNPGFKLPLKGK